MLSPDFFKFCLEVARLCQNKASPVACANNPAQIPPPQVKQGLLLSLSDCHTEIRLGKRHKLFKASLGCSVPVLFLCRPTRLKHLEQNTSTHTYINLCNPQNVPTAQVRFKRFWLVGFGQTVCAEIRNIYNISMPISTLKKITSTWPFSFCFCLVSTSWEIWLKKQ